MTVSPLEMGEVAVRADVDGAARELVSLSKSWPDLDASRVTRLLTTTLAACAYDGAGALDSSRVLRLLAPLRIPLSDDRVRAEMSELLGAISRRRAELNTSKMLEQMLDDLGVPPLSGPPALSPSVPAGFEEVGDLAAAEITALEIDRLLDLRVGELPEGSNLESLASDWARLRTESPTEARHRIDTWLLRTAIMVRRTFPLSLSEQLRTDFEFWSSQAASELASSLGQPFDPAVFGDLGAACLNSQLRHLNPRLFLRHGEALIVAPIGESSEADASEAAMLEEIGYPLLRCFLTIQEERNRGGESRPRKTVMLEIETYLKDVLGRFGVVLLRAVGEEIEFDPSEHQPLDSIEPGELAVVVQPGLRDRQTRRMRIPVTVMSKAAHEHGSSPTNDPTHSEADHDDQ